jgi:hypothetical protein
MVFFSFPEYDSFPVSGEVVSLHLLREYAAQKPQKPAKMPPITTEERRNAYA